MLGKASQMAREEKRTVAACRLTGEGFRATLPPMSVVVLRIE